MFRFSFHQMMFDMFYENNSLSFTRVIAACGYIAFIIASFYLMVTGEHWDHYDIFASYAGGGSAALQFANKFVNSKYNSAMGTYEAREEIHPSNGSYQTGKEPGGR